MAERRPSTEANQAPRKRRKSVDYISLTTHAGVHGQEPVPLNWGAASAAERGPVICSQPSERGRNAIGAHGGSYCIYRGLAVAAGALDPDYAPNYTNTAPSVLLGPHPSWFGTEKIVTIDPFGHVPTLEFTEHYKEGYDIRPTIAVTKAHMDVAELSHMLRLGKLKADGKILTETGQLHVTKAAVEPVWYLPGVARRFGCSPATLRKQLFVQTNGMYPELLTRADLDVFLPPIGGLTIYIFGDPAAIHDPTKKVAVRVHDECNGSDVFGSDICTCRPYLVHGLAVCVETAQQGGCGVIVYFRKEGRALGEVTKYLVYNARKRQEGGDTAAEYFKCTENVAGVEDMRFQALMPDALHWLGITKIDKFVSMSDMKYDAVVGSGIEIVERVPIPPDLVPADAAVEINAKVFKGYDGGDVYTNITEDTLKETKGREWKE